MPVGLGVDSTMAQMVNTLNSYLLKNVEPTIFDQVMLHNPLLYRLWKKGPVIDGGAALTWSAMTGKKTNVGFYTGSGNIPHGVEDTKQPAEVVWRHAAVDVTLAATDISIAKSPHAKVDFVKSEFDTAILSLRALLSTSLYATDPSGIGIDHLLQAIDDGSNFASYAGISHTATNSSGQFFWKPGINSDGVFAAGGAATLTNVQDVYGRASDGDQQPTLCVCNQPAYNFIWGQLQAKQIFERDEEMTKAGFESFRFNRAAVVVDRNLPAQTWLNLNEEWIDLVSLESENFTVDPIQFGTPSQRVMYTKIVWGGNLRVKIVRYQSKITGATNF